MNPEEQVLHKAKEEEARGEIRKSNEQRVSYERQFPTWATAAGVPEPTSSPQVPLPTLQEMPRPRRSPAKRARAGQGEVIDVDLDNAEV